MGHHVGCRRLQVRDADAAVSVIVFYPTDCPAETVSLGPFELDLALDAPISAGRFPLVVISHGTGSSNLVFRSLAMFLSRNGHVVALPEHPGDNLFDRSLQYTYRNLEARPRHLSAVIDALGVDPAIGAALDTGSVAVIGHSVGGYAALAVSGGKPHTGYLVDFAQRETQVPWTALIRENGMSAQAVDVRADGRVRAVVLFAPDFSAFMHDRALEAVEAPVLLMVAEHDDWAAEIMDAARQALPGPGRLDARMVANAGHYSFTSVFPPAMRARVGEAATDPPGFDREGFQETLQADVLAFLRRSGIGPGQWDGGRDAEARWAAAARPAKATGGPDRGAARAGWGASHQIGPHVDYRWRWWVLAMLLAASFIGALDVSVVNVALIPIRMDIGATGPQLTWIVASYILAFALALLPFGRWGDLVGRKRIFIGGLAAFSAASVLCSMAARPDALIAARALQGGAAAMLAPQATAIAQAMFAPQERAGAFALFGSATSIAALLGPVLSGALIHADILGLGWRSVFLVNLPIGLALIVAAMALMPNIKAAGDGQGVDVGGVLLASAAVFCLAFPLIEGRSHGWPAWCVAMFAAAAPLVGALLAWERRQARQGGAMLLPDYLLKSRDYVLGAVTLAVFFSALQGFFFVFGLSLQEGFGYSPLLTGLAGAPFSLGVMVASAVGRWVRDLRTRILVGLAMLILNGVVLRVIVEHAGGDLSPFTLTAPLLVGGLGCGLAVGALFQTVLRNVALGDAGGGAGALQAIQQIGAMWGVALMSALFFARLDGDGLRGAMRASIQGALAAPFAYYIAGFSLAAILTLGLEFKPPAAGHSPARKPSAS